MKRIVLAALAALVILLPAIAGDVTTFVNLGFSADSAYFLFGQYGADTASGKPYAELYLVNTQKNDFVPKGIQRRSFDAALEPGQDLSGALFALYGELLPLARSVKIDHLKPGRLLYLLLDGEEPPASLSFRDFKTGTSYDVALKKRIVEAKESVTSSFDLEVTAAGKDGKVRRVTGGNPDVKRQGVRDYVIRRVIVAPDERTLVLIIEKRMSERGEGAVRYMVETLRLPD